MPTLHNSPIGSGNSVGGRHLCTMSMWGQPYGVKYLIHRHLQRRSAPSCISCGSYLMACCSHRLANQAADAPDRSLPQLKGAMNESALEAYVLDLNSKQFA
ncbi:hypothetical protein HaLaN_26745 [Haematococcus lacustris]|uniref:Uncharacterized protein n=1 Tax=Haematococcus lacustris TaxID=44745 RepID=A0A6A0A6X0_HAELA|nr:hypothetical protein HaLaN_26745 [Haematococcus lacustris]